MLQVTATALEEVEWGQNCDRLFRSQNDVDNDEYDIGDDDKMTLKEEKMMIIVMVKVMMITTMTIMMMMMMMIKK